MVGLRRDADRFSRIDCLHYPSPSSNTSTTSQGRFVLYTAVMSNETPGSSEHKRSASRNRPTTPLRPSSRSSFRDSARGSRDAPGSFPLNTFEPAFAELSDAMADLEANMMHFQLMHESLARFSESFSSFLYGLNMNAFCVDFPEVSGLNWRVVLWSLIKLC